MPAISPTAIDEGSGAGEYVTSRFVAPPVAGSKARAYEPAGPVKRLVSSTKPLVSAGAVPLMVATVQV